MCKYAYEMLSEQTNKKMIFCSLKGKDKNLHGLCIGQKFCPDKDKYVESKAKKICKYYE